MTHPTKKYLDNIDPSQIRPYGDTLNDGKLQLSFTLPVPHGKRGDEAARQFAKKMGLEQPQVYHSKNLGENFTFFIVYAESPCSIDFTKIHPAQIDTPTLSFDEINEYVDTHFDRPISILGACIGTDAHSVGIDAIMNMKGYRGEYGLERYPELEAVNLGMQVPAEQLIVEAYQRNADALLVSQVVTQNNAHIDNLTELIDMLEAEGLRDKLIAVCGGPRISHELALELGYDAGFSSETTPNEVASFVVQQLERRDLPADLND